MPHHPPSDRLDVEQPTRDAAQNRSLLDRADPATEAVLLPSLDTGLTLLDVEGGRGVPVLQALVLDHLLMHDGPAFWVDANGHATSTTLAQIAPSQRLLDRINVARGFTPYQHYGAICTLKAAVTESIQQAATTDGWEARRRDADATPQTPSLIVVPAIDAQYRGADTLTETQAATLQARTLAQLATYADGYDVPVLLTRSTVDEFTTPVATAADRQLTCEQTSMGPRFVGETFETRLYPVDDGASYQTTFAYWHAVLDARATQVGVEPTAASPDSTPGVGAGLTTDGDTTPLTASPLLDAWTATGGH